MSTPPPHIPIPPRGVDYRGKVVLAPMVRSGELPSRLLALRYGADLVWGPETIDKAMIGTTRKLNPRTGTIDFARMPSNPRAAAPAESVIYRLHPTDERGRLVFQLGTAAPATAVEAAKLVAPDVAGIDVNAGCPKPFSTTGGMGAALLKDPERLASILEALVTEVGGPYEIGISVKIRLLHTPELTAALVSRLVTTGITGLTVHCRTTPMRPREPAIRQQLRMIADLCRQAGVACIMNGDVPHRAAALQLAAEYGVDGAMLATAAEANPSVFRPEGVLPWAPVATEYLRVALRVENKWGNTKFTLSQLVPGKTSAGRQLQQARSYAQAVGCLGMEAELGGRAREVDAHLGLAGKEDDKAEQAAARNAHKAAKTRNSALASEQQHPRNDAATSDAEPPTKKPRHLEDASCSPLATAQPSPMSAMAV